MLKLSHTMHIAHVMLVLSSINSFGTFEMEKCFAWMDNFKLYFPFILCVMLRRPEATQLHVYTWIYNGLTRMWAERIRYETLDVVLINAMCSLYTLLPPAATWSAPNVTTFTQTVAAWEMRKLTWQHSRIINHRIQHKIWRIQHWLIPTVNNVSADCDHCNSIEYMIVCGAKYTDHLSVQYV